jgi:hypothetical protein
VRWLNGKGPFHFLFTTRSRDDYLTRYVLREHARGRALVDILDDRYILNRTAEADRARLLDRPEIVTALGAHATDELRATLTRSAA